MTAGKAVKEANETTEMTSTARKKMFQTAELKKTTGLMRMREDHSRAPESRKIA